MKAIHEAVLDPRFRRVIGVMGTQMGKTELLLNEIGRRLDDDPAPVIFVGASQRQVESISNSRVSPMIANTPSLAGKLDGRKTANKVTEKYLNGQRLGFAWAGSAIELSSHPCALVLVDERDRMGADSAGEGDPVALAEARVATYPDGKVIVTSSPTIEDASPVWELWKGGTAAKWSWPCPACGVFFVPCFDLLKWPEKSTPQRAKREARLCCPNCGVLIEDREKSTMNAAGQYEITGDAESDTASFWVSGLASPWRSWGDCAKRWLEAVRSGEAEQRQAIINTVFGELYKLAGEAPEVSKVAALKGAYKSDELPAGARVITCGVDVQKERLYYSVRAWGTRSTSWMIRAGELWGETDQPNVWEDLAALLEARWGRFWIARMLVDSGFRPDMVYAFARRFPNRVLPSKGHDGQARPVQITRIDLNVKKNPSRRGTALAHVDASYFKAWVHGRIAWPLTEPGAWHLPSDTTDDYCNQIVAESRLVRPNGKVIWVLASKRANHYLDCEALNAAAAHTLNVHTLRPRAESESEESADGNALDQPGPSGPDTTQRPFSKRLPSRKNWVTGW
jgi:phage terminase large subunit GpA-like protein